jgi:hypothetical protein
METTTMKTPEEILAEREAVRKSGRLAHTPNGRGEFYARIGCSCYTCRDELDPTGEEDAKAYNEALMLEVCAKTNIPPPPPTPVLTRQDSEYEGFATEPGPFCSLAPSTGAYEDFYVPLPYKLPLPLLPPPSLMIRQPSANTASSIISPLVGIMTPRSEASTIEDRCATQEKQLVTRLKRMVHTYQQLQAHIDELNDHDTLNHDEMAAHDAWWNEVDTKICAVQELLKVLEE